MSSLPTADLAGRHEAWTWDLKGGLRLLAFAGAQSYTCVSGCPPESGRWPYYKPPAMSRPHNSINLNCRLFRYSDNRIFPNILSINHTKVSIPTHPRGRWVVSQRIGFAAHPSLPRRPLTLAYTLRFIIITFA